MNNINKILDNTKLIFIAIVVFWLLILGGFLVMKEYVLQTGESVYLKTVPVDPRDLFRGDYVTLSYEISTLSARDGVIFSGNFYQGATVYVSLDRVDGVDTASSVAVEKPSSGTFIKGVIKNIKYEQSIILNDGKFESNSDGQSPQVDTLMIDYGIESYFVPEGEGQELQRASGSLLVEVKVDKNGNAVIQSVTNPLYDTVQPL